MKTKSFHQQDRLSSIRKNRSRFHNRSAFICSSSENDRYEYQTISYAWYNIVHLGKYGYSDLLAPIIILRF
jgi:hypothetical protein